MRWPDRAPASIAGDALEEFEATGPPVTSRRLSPPQLSDTWIPRPQLVGRLLEAMQARVVLLSAPTGWGKTTLLAEWCKGVADDLVAWLSLTDAENDEERFWQLLTSAVGRALLPECDSAVAGFAAPLEPLAADHVVARLVNAMGSGRRLVVVLDDYHRIEDREIHRKVAYLVENLPASVRLVLASRADPPLPLARWRGNGQLVELGSAQLAFDETETVRLLCTRMKLDIDAAGADEVHRAVEGWPAGVYLAGLGHATAARGHPPSRAASHLVDYLREEVISRQPSDVRDFLVRTCVADRLSPSLCQALTGRDDAAAVLDDLSRRGTFLFRVDDHGSEYRFHRAFAVALRRELDRVAPRVSRGLHRRAATWYRGNGEALAALGHVLESAGGSASDEVVELLLVGEGEPAQIVAIADAAARGRQVPVDGDPQRQLVVASALRSIGRHDEAERWLIETEASLLLSGGDGRAGVRTLTSAARASVELNRLHFDAAAAHARDAVASAVGDPLTLDVARATTIATAYWTGASLDELDEPDGRHARPTTRQRWAAAVTGYRSLACLAAGEYERARHLAEAAVALAGAPGSACRALLPCESEPAAPLAMGASLVEARLPLAAAPHLARALRGARRHGCVPLEAQALLWRARASHVAGDHGQATRSLDEAWRLVGDDWPDVLRHLAVEAERVVARGMSREIGGGRQVLLEPLTATEFKVLRLLATEASYAKIAQRLQVSINTVKTHVQRIRRKLGVTDRANAVRRAAELDLL